MNEFNIYKTIGELQTKAYDLWKIGMTTYYETWVKPCFEAWCKDIKIDWDSSK